MEKEHAEKAALIHSFFFIENSRRRHFPAKLYGGGREEEAGNEIRSAGTPAQREREKGGWRWNKFPKGRNCAADASSVGRGGEGLERVGLKHRVGDSPSWLSS